MDGLAELRRSKGFSQRALAKAAGVSPSTIFALERGGHSAPHPRTAKKLAEAMGVEVVDVLEALESPKAPAPPSLEPSFNDVLEEERREEEEALGRALAHHIHKIREHAEEILQRRLGEATSPEGRRLAVMGFQRSYVHAFALVSETCLRFPPVLVDELRTATDAWRERLLEFYAPPGRGVSVDELPALEAPKLENQK